MNRQRSSGQQKSMSTGTAMSSNGKLTCRQHVKSEGCQPRTGEQYTDQIDASPACLLGSNNVHRLSCSRTGKPCTAIFFAPHIEVRQLVHGDKPATCLAMVVLTAACCPNLTFAQAGHQCSSVAWQQCQLCHAQRHLLSDIACMTWACSSIHTALLNPDVTARQYLKFSHICCHASKAAYRPASCKRPSILSVHCGIVGLSLSTFLRMANWMALKHTVHMQV